jgi:ADP-ribose pyrophosphatase
MIEKFSKIKFLYQGSAVGFRCDEVILPNRNKAQREYLTHPGAVAIVPFLDSPRHQPLKHCRVVMVEQFRYPVHKITEELPAGKLDGKEGLVPCVRRELQEETGYTAKKIRPLLSYCPTPAFSQEVIHIFWADDLKHGKNNPDEDEFLRIKIERFSSLIEKIRKGTIRDSKTVIGLLACSEFLGFMP